MKTMKILSAALLAALSTLPSISSAQNGPTAVMTYDAAGHVTAVGLPGGRTRTFQYDLLGRNTAQSGSGVSVGFGYDGQDRLTGVVDPRGLGTSYNRDGLGQIRSQSSPDTGSTSYSYDGNGNVTQRVNAAGQVEAYTYDAADRVTSKTLTHPTAGSITYSFGYGSGATAGRIVQVTAPGLSMGFGYNLFGEVTAASQSVNGGPTLSASFGYASNGALTSITYPSGRVVSFGLDGASRPSSVSVGSTTLLSGIGYSPLGALAGWSFGNGQGVSRTYDANGRLTGVTLPTGQRTYSYDADDRIVGISDGILGNATYGYDGLDHLTSATTSLGSWTYAYDANGNRTQGFGVGTSVDSGSNRITEYGAPTMGVGVTMRQSTFTADGQVNQVTGNAPVISCGSTVTLGYTAAGQLVTSNVLGAVYGPTGLRLQKIAATCAGGAVTNFVYDPAGHLLGEYDAAGVPIEETVWVGDTPVAVYKSSGQAVQAYYVYADNLNTPRAITNTSGQLVWTWDGEPFGSTAPNENPANLGAFTYGLRFPGQYYDVETGYHQNHWREYDPAVGRYVQSDPMGLVAGINTYAYAGGSPLSFIDPLGLDRWGDTMGLPTHIYITQSTGNGKFKSDDAPFIPMGAAGTAVNGDRFMTFPANSFPDTNYGSPGIADGTYYGVYGANAHLFPSSGMRGPAVVLNNNGPIPTLGPNPAHGGQSFADGIHLHCQNPRELVSRQRGSSGCLTVQGDYCHALFEFLKESDNKNVIIHLVRN